MRYLLALKHRTRQQFLWLQGQGHEGKRGQTPAMAVTGQGGKPVIPHKGLPFATEIIPRSCLSIYYLSRYLDHIYLSYHVM